MLSRHLTTVPGPTYASWAGRAFYWFARNGSYGVSTFFVISGFLITRMVDGPERRLFSPDVSAFYVRRVSRIVPMLLLVCAIGLLVIRLGHPQAGGLAATFREP